MIDPCTIQTCVSQKSLWWYGFFKWLIFGLMLLLLASLLGLRSLKTPVFATAPSVPEVPPQAPSPSLSITELRVGDLTYADSDGYVTGSINVAGLGLPGSIVQMKRDETLVGKATVDVEGRWSFQDDMRLLPGRYRFQVHMLGEDQTVMEQSEVIEMIIPKITIPQPPSVPSANAEPTPPRILGINRDREGNPLRGFFGRGRPNSTLEIVERGRVLGEIRVQDDGSWRCGCSLPPGPHTLMVREIGSREQVSPPMVFTVANPAPPVVLPEVKRDPAGPQVVCPDPLPIGEICGNLYAIAECETLRRIAFRLQTDLPTLMAHNPQVPNPNRIYAGQLLNIPVPASCSTQN